MKKYRCGMLHISLMCLQDQSLSLHTEMHRKPSFASNRLGVNSEGLAVPTTTGKSVVNSPSGAVLVYQVAQVPRARSAEEKPVVTLVPHLDNDGNK